MKVLINNGKSNEDIARTNFASEQREKIVAGRRKFRKINENLSRVEQIVVHIGDIGDYRGTKDGIIMRKKESSGSSNYVTRDSYFFFNDKENKDFPLPSKITTQYHTAKWDACDDGAILAWKGSLLKFEIGGDGIEEELYEGTYDGWAGYGAGVIVKKDKTFIAHRKKGDSILLYEGLDHGWRGYGKGIIIRSKSGALTAYKTGEQPRIIYQGKSKSWKPYGQGAIVKEDNKLIACRDDGTKQLLFDERTIFPWVGYGKGVIINSGNTLTAYKDPRKTR